jgi:hypothetical protein
MVTSNRVTMKRTMRKRAAWNGVVMTEILVKRIASKNLFRGVKLEVHCRARASLKKGGIFWLCATDLRHLIRRNAEEEGNLRLVVSSWPNLII